MATLIFDKPNKTIRIAQPLRDQNYPETIVTIYNVTQIKCYGYSYNLLDDEHNVISCATGITEVKEE